MDEKGAEALPRRLDGNGIGPAPQHQIVKLRCGKLVKDLLLWGTEITASLAIRFGHKPKEVRPQEGAVCCTRAVFFEHSLATPQKEV